MSLIEKKSYFIIFTFNENKKIGKTLDQRQDIGHKIFMEYADEFCN